MIDSILYRNIEQFISKILPKIAIVNDQVHTNKSNTLKTLFNGYPNIGNCFTVRHLRFR